MRAMGRVLVLATISVLFGACGGNGNGNSQQVQVLDPPAAPVVTVSADVKQLIFSWDAVSTATHYRLLENPGGHSGFTQAGDDITSAELSVSREIAVHLHDWVNALYLVQACNTGGCTDSAQVGATDLMLDSIGYFKASNTDQQDIFGLGVSLSSDGRTMAVSSPSEDSGAVGVNGDQADNSRESAGAVYLFRFNGTAWHQQAYIKASNTDSWDGFGSSIALSADGNTLAVGADWEASGARGIDADQANNAAPGAGAVYLFRFDGLVWYQQAYIKASNTPRFSDPIFEERSDDEFGTSVALSADGDTLAVGAEWEASCATGVDGEQFSFDSCHGAGAVYVFRYENSMWYQQAYVKASNTDETHFFGGSVALSADGQTLAVGADWDASSANGINGDQSDNSAWYSGAVYVFGFDGQSWSQQAYVKASNTNEGDVFGRSVALSADGDTLVVGAPGEGSSDTGINGDQADNSAEDAGAVYVFRFDDGNWYQQAYVKASNTEERDKFGASVALSTDGNMLSVGAFSEASSATGINGDQGDNSAPGAGAVYLFRFDGQSWSQQAYVKASDTDGDDQFYQVTLGGDGGMLAVGAYREDSSATGIGGDERDNSVENSGAVYVY